MHVQEHVRRRPPLLALVGRPNVGKSTIFNRLVGRRAALVHDEPGVTRDRLFGELRFGGRALRVVDTGGFDVAATDQVMSGVREQTQLAIDEADLVALVVDADAGLTPGDREVAEILRRAGKLSCVVANKIDTEGHEERVHEIYGLGVEPVFPVSAEHNRGMEPFLEWACERLDAPVVEDVEIDQSPLPVEPEAGEEEGPASRIEWKGGPIRVAVVGRPNAGKSSLINRLLGEERLLATDIPGTTHDAIDIELTRGEQHFVFVDTAGMRRKRSVLDKVERYSVMAAVRSLESADVAVLLLDGAVIPSEQDARIASLALERGKALVIVANKWDLVTNPEWRENFEKAVRLEMPFASFVPFLKVSAKTGKSVERIFDAVIEAQKERHRRVTTGELNRFFREVVESHPPPIQNGKRPKLYFVSQPMVRPPTFVFAASRPDDIHFSYERYLSNSLRARYGFHGTPIWLKFRPHRAKR